MKYYAQDTDGNRLFYFEASSHPKFPDYSVSIERFCKERGLDPEEVSIRATEEEDNQELFNDMAENSAWDNINLIDTFYDLAKHEVASIEYLFKEKGYNVQDTLDEYSDIEMEDVYNSETIVDSYMEYHDESVPDWARDAIDWDDALNNLICQGEIDEYKEYYIINAGKF